MSARCPWADKDPLYIPYHDEEWGVPSHDDRHLFEMLILEGAQAGLSWLTILRKREGYRRAFDGFDPAKVARYTERRQAKLLANPGIVRNRQKVAAAVTNARAFLDLVEQEGSFDRYLWSFVGGKTLQNRFRTLVDVPARTPVSDTLSKDLAKRGFKFVGSTSVYAYMQAVGMVNDHLLSCPRHAPLARAR